MITPRLLNATTVTIEQVDADTTRYDHLRREVRNVIRRKTQFQIDAQVKWLSVGDSDAVRVQQVGADETQTGYFICRQKDLIALGKTISRGDKITKLGDKDVVLYVLRIEFGSHYSGDFSLLKVLFTDREGNDG